MAVSRNRFRFGALVLCLALVAGACGGGDDKTNKVASDKNTTTSTLDVGADVGAGGPTSTGVGGVTGAVTATTKHRRASATTAKPGGATAPGAASGAADPNAVPGPAKVGTYGYAQSGSTPDGPVPDHGTLVVSGGQTQMFKRYYDETKSPLVLTYVFRDNGPYITGATIAAKGATLNCSFGDGVPVPPWPPTPGKTFSGSGSCSSPIGPLTATIAGSITSRDGDLVGITSTVHAKNAANTVDVTLHDVEQWAISLRVPKTSHQTYEGTAFNQPISGDVTSTLTSTP